MPNTQAPKKRKPAKVAEENKGLKEWGVYAIDKVGISGFLIIILVVIFFSYGSIEQKQRFIQKFILLEFTNQELPVATGIIIFLALAYVITLNYYSKRAKLDKKRIQVLKKICKNSKTN